MLSGSDARAAVLLMSFNTARGDITQPLVRPEACKEVWGRADGYCIQASKCTLGCH
jgi:hypothetical protein